MTAVFIDSSMPEDERRARLFTGDVFVFSASPAVHALVDFARGMIEEAFGGLDPRTAQYTLPVEDYAALLAKLKPEFIHHPRSKECIAEILAAHGADVSSTYFDVPRMRSSTSDDYLTSGIAYAFHPHRDTWYSAPMMQLNWWMPIYEVEPRNVMAFHPRYFDQPVANGSATYNYYEWNRTSRADAARHLTKDTREQPKPEQPVELHPQIRVIPPVGGFMLFSGAQFHSSVPNDSGRTRFSIDFRTVQIDDVTAHRGAPNVDSSCTGTTMRDYLRASDLQPLPEDLVAQYDSGPPAAVSDLVYRP
ncbi:MAG: hypothetical protein ACRDYU_04350 [Actinomycetes bacterium]